MLDRGCVVIFTSENNRLGLLLAANAESSHLENNKTPLGAQVIYLLHSIRVNMNNKPLQNKYLKCAPQNVRKVPTFCVFQDPEAESRGSYAWGWIFPAEATFEGPGPQHQDKQEEGGRKCEPRAQRLKTGRKNWIK